MEERKKERITGRQNERKPGINWKEGRKERKGNKTVQTEKGKRRDKKKERMKGNFAKKERSQPTARK